ncbi:CTB family bacteriocin [Leptolyngbya sp. AN02str]|uniref:CTB family bacteriocin n=1 Tax=Leptolyngbya sp. AN02str TaxID=3423363 RepID=UPI003D31D03C
MKFMQSEMSAQHVEAETMTSAPMAETSMTETSMNEVSISELSEADLDTCAGGLSLNLGDFSSLLSGSSSQFGQQNLSFGQATFAGPGGSGTISQLDISSIFSSADQFTAVKQS